MDQGKVRVGIIGSGAMGTLFGYHLASACEVTMLDSNRATLDEIERSGGLRVNDEPPRPVRVGRSSRELYGSNFVILFVKAVDTLRALRPFAGELSPSTPIVSLQNGVGNEDAIKTALGGAVPVVLGITTESSLTVAPGSVRSSQEGNTIIGSGGASPSASRSVADLLMKSGMKATVVYDIRPHLWGKLVANAAINAVSALLDCESGEILKDPNAARLAEALAEEAAEVAAALKINLPFANPVAIRRRSDCGRRRYEELDVVRPRVRPSERDRSHQRRGLRRRTPHGRGDAVQRRDGAAHQGKRKPVLKAAHRRGGIGVYPFTPSFGQKP